MKKQLLFIISSLFLSINAFAAIINGIVLDGTNEDPLPACAIAINPGSLGVQTDIDGRFRLNLKPGKYTIKTGYVGFKPYEKEISVGRRDSSIVICLTTDSQILGEVTVTAQESQGPTSASRIDRAAMQHLQPSSFTDLLELMPGNISQNPNMSGANTIKLRETGSLGATGSTTENPDYDISSLGTLFNVDGAPISNDANMQSIGTQAATSRSTVNKGVDMRSLATDNIESVEIVRGIPSAEYGNLSSGMVNIKRRRSATPWTARFKADGFSKLLYAGKGIAVGASKQNTINFDLGWLDSKVDPRNNLENYQRLTASVRSSLNWRKEHMAINWNLSADFTGTIDKTKADPDLSLTKIDEYKSDRKETSFASALSFNFTNMSWLENVDFNFSATYAHDKLERRLQVAPSRATVAPVSTSEGVHDGHYILGEYISDYLADGKPLTLFAKLRLTGAIPTWQGARQHYKIGANWTMNKNYGRGQVYDLSRPLSASWTSRPRAFSDIPSLNVVGAFLEDALTTPIGNNKLELQAGLHMTSLVGLDSRYDIAGKPYIDPRVNAVWNFPSFNLLGQDSKLHIAGGYGLNTRMPTADYLFPQEAYLDILQLNYYDTSNPTQNSRVNIRTYINDATNYSLRPARNHKWEVRFGAQLGANKLSVTYFEEHMNDGFRYSSIYDAYDYRQYDASSIVSSELQGPPALDNLPYQESSVLRSYRRAENGSSIDKKGIEFTLNTARWRPLATALTITGAWFRTRYSNSMMIFEPVTDVVNGVAVSDKYVGLYDTNDGRINTQFNTNFMFDTQLPRLGLVFTTTIQCMWHVKTRRLEENGTPSSYLSAEDGLLHTFDATAANDPALKYLIRYYSPTLYDTYTIPTAVYVNLKATKTIGRWLRVSAFVNRILDYLPDYTSHGFKVRRNSEAYFGMELNFTL